MMRRGLVALLLVLGACAESGTEGVEPCFRDLAARYEQAAQAIEPGLRENVPAIARSVTDLVEATADRDIAAGEKARDAYVKETDALKEAGDRFFVELEEAHALDVDCP